METDVLFKQQGRMGHIILNRPQVLNAINDVMITDLYDLLSQWAADPAIDGVIIKGAGERAFCAGIDLRYLYRLKQESNIEKINSIFKAEYNLNYNISKFPKTYIAMMHGYTMGGGLGLSVYGSHRIACHGTTFAMPEVTIGFFPDIGASYFLNQCPGYLGLYLALTGTHITGEDGLYAGLATHYLKFEDYEDFISVVSLKNLDALLLKFQQQPKPSSFAELQPQIDRLFGQENFEDVIRALEQDKSEFSKNCLETMGKKSPTSLKITFELMKRARGKSLRVALELDYLLVQKFIRGHDFFEGIRALIVDKDGQPNWQPEGLDEIDGLFVSDGL